MSTLIESVTSFEQFLSDMGLKRVHLDAPENSMGYRLIEYAGADVRVRLIRDKGLWNIKLADTNMAIDTWYDLRLFTYLLDGPAQPNMPFEKQLEYARESWLNIVDIFSPNRRVNSHIRLDAAKKKRANDIFAVWPTAICELESFLIENGLRCISRKEPRFLYDSLAVCYADARLAIRMSSRDGWRLEFADVARDSERWFSFSVIRRALQWPDDKQLSYIESFQFVRAKWSSLYDLFSAEGYCRLEEIELLDNQKGEFKAK